jgi:hypothetical protein
VVGSSIDESTVAPQQSLRQTPGASSDLGSSAIHARERLQLRGAHGPTAQGGYPPRDSPSSTGPNVLGRSAASVGRAASHKHPQRVMQSRFDGAVGYFEISGRLAGRPTAVETTKHDGSLVGGQLRHRSGDPRSIRVGPLSCAASTFSTSPPAESGVHSSTAFITPRSAV